MKSAVFLDRDGTLMENVPYCKNPSDVRVFPGVPASLAQLREAGWLLIVVTNQSGIGRGWMTEAEYGQVDAEFRRQLGIEPDGSYFCPDAPDRPSERRKPGWGMLKEAADEWDISLATSWMVGDSEADMLCGKAAGCRTILVLTGHGGHSAEGHADFIMPSFSEAAAQILKSNQP